MNRPTTLSPAGTASLGPGSGVPAGLLDLMQSSDLDESSAFLAWQLARLPRGPSPAERDDLAMLLGRLLVAQARGSTRLVLDDAACALLASAPELAGSAGTPLVLDGNHLYTQRAHACEARVAVRLATRLEPGPFSPEQLRQAVDDAAAIASPPPSAEQKAAVVAALGRRLGVISGGPGTGKTSTALLLVRSLARLGVPPAAIALTAPTGKAKSRLQEDFRARLGSLAVPPAVDRELLDRCPEAQTLHHLLGATAGPGGFAHRAREPLPYRAVIVDESSMVDLVLMDRLLDALPAAGQLVLLGDADQLPSVSAGAVFRDLGDVATRLRQGFRADPARPTGRQLVALAESIRAGAADTVAALCVTRARVGELRRQGAEHLAAEHRDELLRAHHARLFDPAARGDLIHRVYALRGELFEDDESPRLDYLARCLGQARVLAVTRQGPAGAERCNAFLHDLQGGGPSLSSCCATTTSASCGTATPGWSCARAGRGRRSPRSALSVRAGAGWPSTRGPWGPRWASATPSPCTRRRARSTTRCCCCCPTTGDHCSRASWYTPRSRAPARAWWCVAASRSSRRAWPPARSAARESASEWPGVASPLDLTAAVR
jgi:hypothetical protein